MFHKQVDLAANFRVTGKGPDFYLVARNNEDQCPEWRKKVYKVFVYDEGGRYFCECGFFEHIGILCCHTLRVSPYYLVNSVTYSIRKNKVHISLIGNYLLYGTAHDYVK